MHPRHLAILACIGISVWMSGCGGQKPASPPPPLPDWPTFEKAAAFEDVENLASFGSRARGADGNRYALAYLQSRLKAAGLEPRVIAFTNHTPDGPLVFRNLEAIRTGDTRRIVILTTHYDSMRRGDADFQAANSAGSGPAVLLGIARVLAQTAEPLPAEIRLVFFDGQEPLAQHSAGDGLRGSTDYAARLVAEGTDQRVIAVINLDMVGDRDLIITLPKNVSVDLRQRLLAAAHTEQARRFIRLFPAEIGDDHEPFRERGMPALNIIDFEYGSEPGRNDYWRTAEDTIDKISADSLDIVGRITLRLVRDLLTAPPNSAGVKPALL